MKTTKTLLLLSILVVAVRAQGPDVIVGALTDVANYTSVGGIDAFAIGTDSCNVGTSPLTWIASNNQHPVIGSAAYVYLNGRFRMVGQSWLKHGFTALQQSLCSPCAPNPNGSALGVGCSDPYGAGLNGSQGGLGPKYQVNATSGFFTYPPANPSYSTSIDRRLQVAHAELAQSGAQWFVEGQYIQFEDATGNNDDNNSSWRRASVSGGPTEYTMSMSGPTERMEPAIRAWGTLDPGVVYQTVQTPGLGGGLFTLAMSRTPLGGGMYHYECMLHNLNSHDSAGAFTVNFAPGTSISNMGFHSPGYHSGELPNNNPWAAATASNGVTWTVDQTFAANPNANALRWGTAYSFWFDASSAGPLGASLDFFRIAGSATFPAPGFPPEAWQVNQTNAHMDIDGLSNSSFSGPIVANKNSGSLGALNFGARTGGIPYDIALTLSPAVPNFIVTGGGQRININLFHPTFTWLFGTFGAATPGTAWNLPFVAPNGTLDLTGQMAILDGASPEGLLISAANELHVTLCTPGSEVLSLGDDTTATINLGAGSFACVPSVTFAGTSYTTAYVNSNGSVSFVQGTTDYTSTTGEFNSQMPRLAGLWTDLNPSSAGTVTAASTIGGLFTVTFAGVAEFGNASATSSFVLEFNSATGSCAIASFSPSANHGSTSLVGLSPGNGAAGLARTFSTYVGAGPQVGGVTNSVYQIVSNGTPTGFSRIEFPTSNGATFIVN